VSVLLPVYNGGRYLKAAIKSILSQTLADFELIIVNDGSTDRTREIIERFQDSRIVAFHRDNHGLAASLNFGLQVARTPFVARMDADDLCLPDRLETQVAEIESQPDIAALGGHAVIIDDEGRNTAQVCTPPENHEDILKGILELRGDTFLHPTTILRKDTVLAVGGYNERFFVSQDIDLWLRLGAVARLGSLPRVVLKFRQHQDSISRSRRRDGLTFGMVARICYWIRQKGLDDPSIASDAIWREFKATVTQELALRGMYELDAYRIDVRKILQGHSFWERLLRLSWSFMQNPRRLMIFGTRRQYLRIQNHLIAQMCFRTRR